MWKRCQSGITRMIACARLIVQHGGSPGFQRWGSVEPISLYTRLFGYLCWLSPHYFSQGLLRGLKFVLDGVKKYKTQCKQIRTIDGNIQKVLFVCSRYQGKDEPVTERDPGEERPLWAGDPIQRVRGRGATPVLPRWGWSCWLSPGIKGLSGLLGVLSAGHGAEHDHRPDQRRSGQHRVWHHPHTSAHHDRIWLPLPLHGTDPYVLVN